MACIVPPTEESKREPLVRGEQNKMVIATTLEAGVGVAGQQTIGGFGMRKYQRGSGHFVAAVFRPCSRVKCPPKARATWRCAANRNVRHTGS